MPRYITRQLEALSLFARQPRGEMALIRGWRGVVYPPPSVYENGTEQRETS